MSTHEYNANRAATDVDEMCMSIRAACESAAGPRGDDLDRLASHLVVSTGTKAIGRDMSGVQEFALSGWRAPKIAGTTRSGRGCMVAVGPSSQKGSVTHGCAKVGFQMRFQAQRNKGKRGRQASVLTPLQQLAMREVGMDKVQPQKAHVPLPNGCLLECG